MARTGVYRVSALAYYMVMEPSTIFIGICAMDTRSLKFFVIIILLSEKISETRNLYKIQG